MRESVLQDQIRLALGRDPRVVLFRNNVGVADFHGKKVRFGVGGPGGSDLIGILKPSGRFVALEVKNSTGRVTPEQHRYLELVRRAGGFGAVVRCPVDALAAIERASTGACE